ncbi:hypothetical protein Y657_002372 [Salmonella enterica subsp. enterica]|nr:hypothetical protein [Salmonella enterica subsp. enterica]
MSKAYFSPSNLTFIPESWKNDGTYTDETWPSDAILLTDEQTEQFWKQNAPSGKILGVDNGLPAWVDIPQLMPDELYESELKSINDVYEADKAVLRDAYINALLFDGPTEQTKRTAIYNQLLARNQEYASNIEDLEQKYGG